VAAERGQEMLMNEELELMLAERAIQRVLRSRDDIVYHVLDQ
jgi:hypothetical protein